MRPPRDNVGREGGVADRTGPGAVKDGGIHNLRGGRRRDMCLASASPRNKSAI